jgi:hypothetical protein
MLNSLTNEVETTLKSLLPADRFRDTDDQYTKEPRGRYSGQKSLVALPRSTAEVSALVTACAQARVGIVPFGGGTGLVGGQVAEDGPKSLILSLEKMNAVCEVYAEENVLIAEAGGGCSDGGGFEESVISIVIGGRRIGANWRKSSDQCWRHICSKIRKYKGFMPGS